MRRRSRVNDVGTFGDVGRNTIYGPQLYSFDMGSSRISGSRNGSGIQFRAEMFNIFNQVNFTNPNNVQNGGGFGTITSVHPASGDPRIIQFALKLAF